jgi:outer membrane receptor protein involved in Fe transport
MAPSVSPGGEPVNGSLRRTTDYLTWSLTPEYRWSDDLMTWLTVARGGKSGGFNTGFGDAPLREREFGDETIDHVEAGTRANLAMGRIRLSASAFRTRYHDYQDAAFISAQFSVGNADLVDLKGLEFEGTAVLGSGTNLNLAASYADLTYVLNTTGMCFPGRVPDGSVPGSCDLSGEHPINAPPWVVNAAVIHSRPTDWGTLYGRLEVSWKDRYNTSSSADPRLKQASHSDLGLRLGATFGNRFEGTLWVENLLDENVVNVDAVLNLFDDASYQSYLLQPRAFGATLRVFF